ncbi:MAG: hypothetical protein EAX95_12675 [Candidatus Thorarchaeota archaeon]|nr:hypothetical protein [Candidatus Thorarchaeota archaeon]
MEERVLMFQKNGALYFAAILGFLLLLCCASPAGKMEKDNLSPFEILAGPEEVMHRSGTPHGPIAIDGDANFSETALAEGWSGDGSSGNPYIINGLDINLGGAAGHCINISNTRANFTISHCNLSSASVNPGAGIYMNNVTNGNIIGNTFLDDYYAIYLIESDNNIIADNVLDANTWGVHLNYAEYNLIDSNTCTNHWRGIVIYRSSLNNVTNNNCSYNAASGIAVTESSLTIVENNTCTHQTYNGIDIGSSNSILIRNNTCVSNADDGILLEYSSSNTVANNTCITNGHYGIATIIEMLGIDSNAIIDNTCTGSIIGVSLMYSQSSTVANNTCNGNSYGIYLQTALSNEVSHNTCNGNSYGIYLQTALSNEVSHNTCNGNSDGIYLKDSDSNWVANNTCNSNTYGVYLEDSDSNSVANNTCSSNTYGVYLEDSDSNSLTNSTCSSNTDSGIYLEYSNSNSLNNNTCSSNTDSGIYLFNSDSNPITKNTCSNNALGIYAYYSSYNSMTNNTCSRNTQGIYLYCSDSNTAANNTCADNGNFGFHLYYSLYCTVSNNTCIKNEYGIGIEFESSGNNVYWNVFIDNTVVSFDSVHSNIFDYNFWSDYVGYDADENGVGDTPYSLSGNQDQHPLMAPPGSLPFWLESPIDQVLSLGIPLRYDLNASVYRGIDNWWINDTLYFAINQSGVVSNATFLLAENYGLQVFANDTNGNILTGTFTVIVEDWFVPIWLEQPYNQLIECGTTLLYQLDALDTSGLDSWWLNDTLCFAVDESGIVSTVGIVPVGVYGVQVWVNDTWGNTLTGNFTVTVVDTTSPTWIEEPQDQIIEYGLTLIFDLNATDPSGIGEWWVDNACFAIDWLGQVRTVGVLEPGIYGLRVYVNDIFENMLCTQLIIEIRDTTPPEWLSDVTDQYLDFGEVFEYLLAAYDLSGIDHWILNDTLSFQISQTGRITNKITLQPGNYALHVSVFDAYGNELTADFTVYVEEVSTTTTTTSTTTTELGRLDPLLMFGIGGGLGAIAVLVAVALYARKKS